MATIIEFELPADEFALHDTLTACPDADFEVERVIATDPEQLIPYVWVQTPDFEALERAFDADPTVADTTLLSATDEERAYRIEWTGAIDLIIHLLTEQDGTITHADGHNGMWKLRALFPDRAALSQAHDYATDHGVTFDVRAIYELEDERRAQLGLTETQYDSLRAGFEAGYFEVPRQLTLGEFADQEGISHQALSERLRRGLNSLLEQTLSIGTDEDETAEQ